MHNINIKSTDQTVIYLSDVHVN